MRPRSARPLRAYRSPRTTTNSSRVAMLTRLIPTPAPEHRRGTNQVRQQVTIREHFRRRNATSRAILGKPRSNASVAQPIERKRSFDRTLRGFW
jgi:hypothetical protein